MTSAVKAPRKAHKPARSVTESKLPVTGEDKLDLKAVLLAALTVPGKLSGCYSRFHRYSFLNMILVWMQTGRFEPIATYRKWSDLGRTVTRGQRALFVNHPHPVYKRDDETGQVVTGEDGKPIIKFVMFQPKATVFQLFQTDGPELTYPETPDWNKDQALSELGITEVPFNHDDGNVQGYSVGNTVAINPVAVAPLKTMIHEIGHIVLGHTDKDNLKEYQTHRGIREFQAESVALLVCRELAVEGFDESASRAYIQTWLGVQGVAGELNRNSDTDEIELADDSAVREIFSAVDKILVAGRKSHWNKLSESEAS